MTRWMMFGGCLAALVVALPVTADEAADLKVGDPAPKFSAPDETGQSWSSQDHVGKKVLVVYFYPANFTGGCTRQACSFRDDMNQLTELGVQVVGVSGDTPESHAMFKKHHDLNFTLLADFNGAVAKAFGVPTRAGGTVKFEGQSLERGVTTSRWTFVIDGDGKIAMKNTSVNAAGDSKQVLEFVKKHLDESAAQ